MIPLPDDPADELNYTTKAIIADQVWEANPKAEEFDAEMLIASYFAQLPESDRSLIISGTGVFCPELSPTIEQYNWSLAIRQFTLNCCIVQRVVP